VNCLAGEEEEGWRGFSEGRMLATRVVGAGNAERTALGIAKRGFRVWQPAGAGADVPMSSRMVVMGMVCRYLSSIMSVQHVGFGAGLDRLRGGDSADADRPSDSGWIRWPGLSG
jgi:hypothetical protein